MNTLQKAVDVGVAIATMVCVVMGLGAFMGLFLATGITVARWVLN